MKILLSPAKSIKTDIFYPKVEISEAHFLDESEKLVKKLQKYKAKSLAALFHVSADIAELNVNRFQNWERAIEEKEDIIPTIFAFTGEVYRGLDAVNMNSKELDYLNDNLRILSGLYGILKPFDLLFPYRLEMGTKIDITPKITNLYQYWGDKLVDFLNKEEQEVIINLASIEYFKAINTKKAKSKIITPIFKELRNGEYKIVMTFAKNARGQMAKYCAQNQIQNPEELKKFNLSSYEYMENLSTETDWVFAR